MRVASYRRVRAVRGAIVLAGAALLLLACVDGTTPNCSDAAAGCGPDLDGAIVDVSTEGGDGGDATTDAPAEAAPDAPGVDAPVDAPRDANDAGDAKAG